MSALISSPTNNRALSSIVGKVETHLETALTALSDMASIPDLTAPFNPKQIAELRNVGFQSFGTLDIRDQVLAGKKPDQLSMETFSQFVGDLKTNDPQRCIVFVPRTSIFITFDQDSYELANQIKLSAATANDDKLLLFGRIGNCLHRYIDALKSISSIIDNQVKQGTLAPDLAAEAKKNLEPFGPLGMNAESIKSLSALSLRTRKEFLKSFDDETCFFIVALAVVYAEQHREIIESHLRKIGELPQMLVQNLNFKPETVKPTGMAASAGAGSSTITVVPQALIESPLASERITAVRYDPRQERQSIASYLQQEFSIDPAVSRYLAKCAVRMSLSVGDLQKVHQKLEERIGYAAKQSMLWGMEGLASLLVGKNPLLLLMTVGEKFDHYSNLLTGALQNYARVQFNPSFCNLNPITQPGRYASVADLQKIAASLASVN